METIEIVECPSCGNKHIYSSKIGQSASTIFVVRRVQIRPSEKFTRLFTCPKTGYMFQALITVAGDKVTEAKAFPISPLNVALFESAKKELIDSVDAARKFSQFMITLNAGLIPAYLALLKFVGIDENTASIGLKIIGTVPPFLFLGSCTLFIMACFPRIGRYSLEISEEIESARDSIIQKRRKWIFFAATLFLVGMLTSVITIIVGLNN